MRRRRCPKDQEPRVYYYALCFARMLPVWTRELAAEQDDIQREFLQGRIDLINHAADEAVSSDAMRPYLISYVCDDVSIDDLIARGMPCGRDYLIQRKQQFLAELARRIK